jgi:serine/threonine-protein kinase
VDTAPSSQLAHATHSGNPHSPGCTCKSCTSPTLIFCPENGVVAHATGRLAAQVRDLLRVRLIQSALIIGGAITAFGIFGWVSTGWMPWPMLGVPLLSAAAALTLHLRPEASRLSMRVIETVLFQGSAAMLTLAPILAAISPAGSPGFLDPNLAVYRISVAVFGLMVVYGMFVPNSFGRAAVFLGMLLVAPVLVPVVCSLCLPLPSPGVQAEHLFYNLILLCIGATVSAFGAHTLSSMRSAAAHIQDTGMYRLTEKIGQGGMGEVWKAEHRLLARPAAIKVIRPELMGLPDRKRLDQAIARFQREARITASLRSPHTVSLFDFGVTCHGTFFYVMEYLDGLDLEQLIRRFGPQPADRVAFLMRQAAESLAEAHERGLVHRDVKPSNLHVGRVGVRYDFLKVLDFGLVKVQNGGGGDVSRLTVDGVTTGTPAFMAPELALGRPAIDHRVDIYAFGCVAYWLLTGLLVFEGATPVEIVVNHVRSAPVPPSRRCEMPIPDRLEELVMACLAKEPEQRPQDLTFICREIDESGLAQTWTQARAREWWQGHLPG